MVLNVADIERWNAGAVREVFHAATARGNATMEASRQLSTLAVFDTWEGLTAEARKHTNASIRQDLDDHGNESLAVGRAAGKAADDIEKVQSELRTLRHDAAELHMAIDPLTNKIIPTKDALQAEAVVAEIQLQPRLDKILAEANAVDAELAAAINMAEGNAPTPISAPSGPPGTQDTNSAMPPASTQPKRPNDQAGVDAAAAAQAAQGRPDPTDPHYTRSPLTDPVVAADPSVIARQAGKVADARRALDAAQAKLDAAASQAYTQGPGSGPGRGVTDPLSQAVFAARRNLTEQTAILDELNKSATTTGAARPIPAPPLPPNASMQAFPPEPSIASQAARGLTESSHDINKSTFGLVPDVAKDIHTFGHWSDAATGDRADALLDSASLIPGGKLLGEAHHGLGALTDAVRHGDDIPTPHTHVDTPDAPALHTDTPPVHNPAPVFDLTTDHAVSLGADPARGGSFVSSEAETGLRIEHELGVDLSRAEAGKSYDFIDPTGKTYDAVGNFSSKFFDAQWSNLQDQIIRHSEFKADIVPVDVSKFTVQQQAIVRKFVEGLNNPNVIIIGEQ